MLDDVRVQDMREALPEYLARTHNITNIRRPFACIHPGHDDRHPSMSFDAKTSRVKCFSCGVSGDVFDVAEWDTGRRDFPERVRIVADVLGMEARDDVLPYRKKQEKKRVPMRHKPAALTGINVLDGVQDAFVSLYEPQGKAALDYLYRRGLSDTDMLTHGFGWVQHPSDLFPDNFKACPQSPQGFIVLPFPEGADFASVRYVVFRSCAPNAKMKEVKPSGMAAPLWREYLLRGSGNTVYIVEGVFDAVAISLLMGGVNTCALCGNNTARLLNVVADTRHDKRPRLMLALDCDEAGAKMAATIADGLREIGAPFDILPAYPDNAKDANEAWEKQVSHG